MFSSSSNPTSSAPASTQSGPQPAPHSKVGVTLALLAAAQSAVILALLAGSFPGAEPTMAAEPFPNALAQREQMIVQLAEINERLELLVRHVEEGALQSPRREDDAE